MEKSLFSVIICTYNRQQFLKECLEAISLQTLDSGEFRILVIDNNSKDETPAVVKEYQKRLSRLEYYFEPKQGISHARNRGIKESVGAGPCAGPLRGTFAPSPLLGERAGVRGNSDYLLFLDDDAILSPESLANLHDYLQSHPETLIVGGKAVIKYLVEKPVWVTPKVEAWMGSYNYGDDIIEVNAENIRKKRVRLPIGCCFTVKRTLLEELGGFHPSIGRDGKKMLAGEETLIGMKALEKSGTIIYLPGVYVDHMIEPSWVDQQFMLDKTYHYGTCELLVQKLSGKSLFCILRYLLFRSLFLVKNLLDIAISRSNSQKVYETRLLLNFHLGIFSRLILR